MPAESLRTLSGSAVALRGDNIDTDRIIPARFLRSVSFEGLEDHLFEDDRAQLDAAAPGTHPLSNPAYLDASILIVNRNFGCGSSREHAPQSIRRRGIRAVIGESFSEIFFGNSVALGLPCVTADASVIELLMSVAEGSPDARFALDLDAQTVTVDGRSHSVRLPAGAREAFLNGTWDATALLLDRFEEVEAVAARLPYVSGWISD